MQTRLADFIRGTAQGDEAEAILRKCVHCGFCTATCPTYQLLGDELDGPRGRIYLIKQTLEGSTPTARTQLHLDRCLTCRSCETTCPSGVRYGKLLDIGRAVVEKAVRRPLRDRLMRRALAAVVPRRARFAALLRAAQAVRPLLPPGLRASVPAPAARPGDWPAPRHPRRMLVLGGCAQPALAPRINAAAARVLDRLGISLIEVPAAGCCGALRFHLNFHEQGLDDMRRVIDAWWPAIEQGVEAIVMTASGCGITVKDYGALLAHDDAYREKAQRVSGLVRDLSEVVAAALDADEPGFRRACSAPASQGVPAGAPAPCKGAPGWQADAAGTTAASPERAALHIPCTLQHGQALGGVAERVVRAAGFQLTPVRDAHLCCGSAGSYSIVQRELSHQLREKKLAALQAGGPTRILTANIGCLHHLAGGASVPVEHWVVAVDRRMGAQGQRA
jgi:glycolate oxidase iron-sulfur subunit